MDTESVYCFEWFLENLQVFKQFEDVSQLRGWILWRMWPSEVQAETAPLPYMRQRFRLRNK